jgi:hypothetical protein
MGVTIVILTILLILYHVRKSRLQVSKDPYSTLYARDTNAGLAHLTAQSGAVFVPTAFDGRPKNLNAEIPSQQAAVQFNAVPGLVSYVDPSATISPTSSMISQPNASGDATAKEEIRLLRERMATLESQLQASASASAVEGSRTDRRMRSPISAISEVVPTYSED